MLLLHSRRPLYAVPQKKYSVCAVEAAELFEKGMAKAGGLSDPRMGTMDKFGGICTTDGANMHDCPGYFGHIELAQPVYHCKHLGCCLAEGRVGGGKRGFLGVHSGRPSCSGHAEQQVFAIVMLCNKHSTRHVRGTGPGCRATAAAAATPSAVRGLGWCCPLHAAQAGVMFLG